MKLTSANLQERCQYWLKEFGLVEWMGERPGRPGVPRVRAKFRSKEKMKRDDGGYNEGGCTWQAEYCTADIDIMRGHGEDCLVHEILHLVLEGHKTYDPEKYDECYERALNRSAACIVGLAETRAIAENKP